MIKMIPNLSVSIICLLFLCTGCKKSIIGKEDTLRYDLIKTENSDVNTVIKRDSLGHKLVEGNIIHGKKNGSWITYNGADQVIDITNYIEDVKQGPYLKLIGNTVDEQGSYKDNKLHGIRIKYLYGKIDEKIEFKDGIRNGWATKFYSNGNIQREMEILDSVQVGFFRFYGENGKLQIEEKYKDGKKVSGGIVK